MATILFACKGEPGEIGPTGLNSLIAITNEPAGVNCPSGGTRIDVGVDSNSNGVLDADEVQSTEYICDVDGSNELRLDFNMASNAVWSTSSSMTISEFNGIPDFNIQNFQGVDSVAFGAYIQSGDAATNCILELYDETNNAVIANSIISTNSTSYVWVTTQSNFLSEFPEEHIDLRMRLTSDNGANVSFKVPRLILLWE